MKKALGLLVLLAACASEPSPKQEAEAPKQHITIADVLALGHETGCKDGFIVVWEMGAYQRPSEFKTAEEAWEEVKRGCNFKNLLYRADLEDVERIKK